MNDLVRNAWSDVDLALFVVDGAAGVGRGDARVATDLRVAGCPIICVVNKTDSMKPHEIAGALATSASMGEFDEFVPLSALTGDGVDLLRELVVARMPEGPMYYPEGTSTDQPPRAFVAELVREKLLSRTRDELPHSIAVVTEEYEERDDGLLEIQASIFVERDSQKGIVIGKGGRTLRTIGSHAREEMERVLGTKVFLDLHVKVVKEWQRDPKALERLGY